MSSRWRHGVGIAAWVVGGVLWIKIASMLLLGSLTSVSWADEEYVGGERYASLATVGNLFEPHKALFNSGTMLAARGQLVDALQPLRDALRLADGQDECVVRLNLSLVLEALGTELDLAQQPDAAQVRRDEARAVLSPAPASCDSPELAEINVRLGQGETPSAEPEPAAEAEAPSAAPAPIPPEQQAAVDELTSRMSTGRSELQTEEERTYDRPEGTSDRPW